MTEMPAAGRKAEGDLFPWEKTDLVDAIKSALTR